MKVYTFLFRIFDNSEIDFMDSVRIEECPNLILACIKCGVKISSKHDGLGYTLEGLKILEDDGLFDISGCKLSIDKTKVWGPE